MRPDNWCSPWVSDVADISRCRVCIIWRRINIERNCRYSQHRILKYTDNSRKIYAIDMLGTFFIYDLFPYINRYSSAQRSQHFAIWNFGVRNLSLTRQLESAVVLSVSCNFWRWPLECFFDNRERPLEIARIRLGGGRRETVISCSRSYTNRCITCTYNMYAWPLAQLQLQKNERED